MIENVVKLKNKLIKENKKGLALDIDETLSFTISFLVQNLIEGVSNPENLTALEISRKYKHSDNIPYWHDELSKKIKADLVNSSEFYEDLPLIENANRVVNEINKILPIVAYITVRPKSAMKATQIWLDKHGFPKADLITKPNDVERIDGNKWKAGVLEYLYPQILGIVDDNPRLTDFLSKKYKGTIYLYDSTEIKRKDIKVIPCENWEDVAEKIIFGRGL